MTESSHSQGVDSAPGYHSVDPYFLVRGGVPVVHTSSGAASGGSGTGIDVRRAELAEVERRCREDEFRLG
jgi:hypothetical protein